MATDIPLGEGDYFRRSAGNPSIITRNVYYEVDPTNVGGQKTLIRRPGIKKVLSVGVGPVRKIYYRPDVFDNDFFVVSGYFLYRIGRQNDETFTSARIEGLLGGGDIDMTASGEYLFLTDNESLYYSDGDTTTPLAAIETPDDVAFSRLAYVAGYILCVVKDSQRFYWIDPGDTTIDPLNFAEAEGLPDGIVDVIVLGDQIYFFGTETIEVWYLSGDAASPFQRIQGKLMNIGVVEGTACTVASNDTFFFIAADGTARIGVGLDKVSNPGVEERFRRAIKTRNLANL